MSIANDVATANRVSAARAEFELRNEISSRYLARHGETLAIACRAIAERFRRGGRLLAVGVGAGTTDAQHVSVEFVHPVIVGKRALPALDLSTEPGCMLKALARPEDIVLAFAGPAGDERLDAAVDVARRCGALTLQWPGRLGDTELPAASSDSFIHQEITELMYHSLWETVHVFLEQAPGREDAGAAGFLYPFLGGSQPSEPASVLADVAGSMRQKGLDDELLRTLFAEEQLESLVWAAASIRARIDAGATLFAFGNGGSATDANDFVWDCVSPPAGLRPIPAISLALEPATLTAIANDVGVELLFSRQLSAHAKPGDVAIAISTSGTSKNLAVALEEARKRGMLTIGLAGYDGGDFVRRKLVDHAFVVRSEYIPRIQETQASIYHVLRRLLDENG